MNIYFTNLPQLSFEHALDQVTSAATIRVKDLPLEPRQRQTNGSITLAGRTADPLRPQGCGDGEIYIHTYVEMARA